MDIALRGAAALLTLALPLAVAAWVVRRWKSGWRLILIGAVTFVASQVFHLPFNAVVLNPVLAELGFGSQAEPGWRLAAAAVLLGLSAGVFEEGARWLVYRFWARRARSWNDGVTLGAGHGGAEALFVGLAALATLLQLAALRGQDLATIVPADQLALAEAQVEAYWALPGWAFFLAAVERASAMVVQISLAVMVMQAFVRPAGAAWLLAVIGWHALVDAVAVFVGVSLDVYSGALLGALVAEGAILVLALASLAILLRLRPIEKPESQDAPPPPHSGPLPPAPASDDQLRASRHSG